MDDGFVLPPLLDDGPLVRPGLLPQKTFDLIDLPDTDGLFDPRGEGHVGDHFGLHLVPDDADLGACGPQRPDDWLL
jgi:hypothetical protein